MGGFRQTGHTVFYVIARRELSCSGRVYLLRFIVAIVADYSMSEGCITRGVAEVIIRLSHEALEHLNCLICPSECPIMAGNRVDRREKLLTARKVTVIEKASAWNQATISVFANN